MVPGISAGAMAVLDYVASTQGSTPWVLVSDIGPAIGLDAKTVRRGRRSLSEYGLVIAINTGRNRLVRATILGQQLMEAYMRAGTAQ